MTEDTTYNGWTNYPTWCVSMFLDGNYTGEGTYRDVIELVREASENADINVMTNEPMTRYSVQSALKGYVEEAPEDADVEGLLYADLLGWAISHVNWYELADAWIELIKELQDA